MKEQPETDDLLRQFLLGKVDDEERQRIESLFLTDPQSRDKVLAAEQDLIEDYLDDCLTAADKERFLLQYGDTPAQRRKLRIAKTIQDWAAMDAIVPSTATAPISIWNRLRARIRLKPLLFVPIAVTAVLALMVAVVWVNRQREQQSIERELARLNAPSTLREVPSQMLTPELTPVSVRSVERETELTPRSDVTLVEVRLLWIQKEQYPKYKAVVRRFSDDKSYNIPDLQPVNNGGHKIIIRLPPRMLTRGLYQIRLTGVAADGAIGTTEEYKFTVGG